MRYAVSQAGEMQGMEVESAGARWSAVWGDAAGLLAQRSHVITNVGESRSRHAQCDEEAVNTDNGRQARQGSGLRRERKRVSVCTAAHDTRAAVIIRASHAGSWRKGGDAASGVELLRLA